MLSILAAIRVSGLKTCRASGTVLLAFLVLASMGQAQTESASDMATKAGRGTTPQGSSMDFKLYHGYLVVVPGSVGGLKNLHFLVDTGARESIADRRLVEKLGKQQQTGSIRLLSETVSAKRAVLRDIQAGPLSAKSLSIVAVDLSSLKRSVGTDIDMLIGLDFMGQSSFTIDYLTRRITFGSPDAFPSNIPMDSGPPFVTVTANLDGQPVRLVVNTAAPALLLYAPDGVEPIRTAKIDEASHANDIAGGWIVSKAVIFHSVRLAEVELGQQPAFMIKAAVNAFNGSLPIPGTFSAVAFDFEHHVLGFRK